MSCNLKAEENSIDNGHTCEEKCVMKSLKLDKYEEKRAVL